MDALSCAVVYRLSPRLRDAHAPRGAMAGGSLLNRALSLMAECAPVQLLRIGQLYLIGIPAEVTIVAGLRLRYDGGARARAGRIPGHHRDNRPVRDFDTTALI